MIVPLEHLKRNMDFRQEQLGIRMDEIRGVTKNRNNKERGGAREVI